MKPTEDEIKAEIARLTEMKPRVRGADVFGGDNRAKMAAMIVVLEEGMDEDAIYERWGDDDDPDVNMDLISCARDAREWMAGEKNELPSEGWEALVQE